MFGSLGDCNVLTNECCDHCDGPGKFCHATDEALEQRSRCVSLWPAAEESGI